MPFKPVSNPSMKATHSIPAFTSTLVRWVIGIGMILLAPAQMMGTTATCQSVDGSSLNSSNPLDSLQDIIAETSTLPFPPLEADSASE